MRFALFVLLSFWFAAPVCDAQLPRLKISDDHRFLVREDGAPFFYLGDTAWELFHRLNREDADRYLADRARKGFTVIQAVVLAEFGGLTEPNPYGQLPLVDNDPARPREEYFQHVDWIVQKAAALIFQKAHRTVGILNSPAQQPPPAVPAAASAEAKP